MVSTRIPSVDVSSSWRQCSPLKERSSVLLNPSTDLRVEIFKVWHMKDADGVGKIEMRYAFEADRD
jgi:hypothetical protein